MKRVYSQPDIIFESFSLSTSIAGDCEMKTNTPRQGTCAFEYEGNVVFTISVAGCRLENGGTPIQDSANNGFCYHVPIASNTLFNS